MSPFGLGIARFATLPMGTSFGPTSCIRATIASRAAGRCRPFSCGTSEQIVVTAALKGRVIVQEMQLFRRRLSPKCNITAGEAPEFGNHVAMRERVGIVTAVFTKPFRDERHATILVG